MRFSLLSTLLVLSTFCFGQGEFTTNYNANGNTGFGGAIGGATLAITDKQDSIVFTLTKGTGAASFFDSVLVFYLQVPDNILLTNISSTTTLPGDTDPYKAAVAGLNTDVDQRAVLNFPTDFHPNGAIAMDKNGGKVFFFVFGNLVEKLAFTIDPSGTNSAPVYRVAASKAGIGITGNPAFKFVATYVGPGGSRSNESFGDPFTGFTRMARTASYNPHTITNYFIFASTLPVKLTDFKAAKEKDGVNLSWSVAQESGINNYDVQRSGNGINFKSIKTMTARNASAPSSYSVKDVLPNTTGAYYRLAITENDKTQYSKVVYVSGDKTKGSLVASLQSANAITIALNGIAAGKYKLSVLNNVGQIVHEASLQHDGANASQQLNLQSNLSRGIYRVVLQSATDKFVASILVQ